MTTLAHNPLGASGLWVSQLALGVLTFGRETTVEDSRIILDTYLAAGGNYVDTADVYNDSEVVLGRLMKGRREELVVATKVGLPTADGANDEGGSRRYVRRQCENSLRRLGTDHIDVYFLHVFDSATPLEETLSTLDDLVRVGKVRYLGVSNWAAWRIAKALGVSARNGWERFVALTPEYSLVERGVERDLLPVCRSEGLGVLPWSPLGGGMLSGKYRPDVEPPPGSRATRMSNSTASMRRRLSQSRSFVISEAVREIADRIDRAPAQVALNWLMNRDGVTAPVMGVRTLDQLTDNLGAVGWELDRDDARRLDEVSAIELGYPHDWDRQFGIRQGPRPDRQISGVR